MRHGSVAFPSSVGTPRLNGPQGFGKHSFHVPVLGLLPIHEPSFLSTHRFPSGKVLAILCYFHLIKDSEEFVFLEGIGYFGDVGFQVIHLL